MGSTPGYPPPHGFNQLENAVQAAQSGFGFGGADLDAGEVGDALDPVPGIGTWGRLEFYRGAFA